MSHTTPEKSVRCPLRRNISCSASDCVDGYNCMYYASAAAQTIIEEKDHANAAKLAEADFDPLKNDPDVKLQFITEVLRQVQAANN